MRPQLRIIHPPASIIARRSWRIDQDHLAGAPLCHHACLCPPDTCSVHPTGESACSAKPGAAWVAATLYMALLGTSNLIWEVAQLPLYTVVGDRGLPYGLRAALHCTGGDLLIGAGSLGLAWGFFGRRRWPAERRRAVAMAATAAGLVYTAFSEWMNTQVHGSWAYSELMPVLPWLGIGLAPLLQWLLLPPLCLLASHALQHRPQ